MIKVRMLNTPYRAHCQYLLVKFFGLVHSQPIVVKLIQNTKTQYGIHKLSNLVLKNVC